MQGSGKTEREKKFELQVVKYKCGESVRELINCKKAIRTRNPGKFFLYKIKYARQNQRFEEVNAGVAQQKHTDCVMYRDADCIVEYLKQMAYRKDGVTTSKPPDSANNI